MAWLRRLIGGFNALFRRHRVEQEFDEELREYLETSIEEKMRAGMAREGAIRAARIEIGSLEAVKDHTRDVGWEARLESLWRDVRYALRTLRKAPGFTAAAVLTLALGIGATTAIFSVVNSLLLRTLPVAEPERLVTISGPPGNRWTYAIWNQIRQRVQPIDGALAWSAQEFNLSQGGEVETVDGLYASGDFFRTLGVPALIGRTFTSVDDVRGDAPDGPVAVISYGLWHRRFGGAASVVGTTLVVERIPFTIIGVMPAEFFGVEVGRAFDVILPLTADALIRGKNTLLDGPGYFLTVMLRLKPGQSLDTATAMLRAMQPQIREAALPRNVPSRFQQTFLTEPLTLTPAGAGTSRLRQQYGQPLLAIFVVVSLVLLIACATTANLLLARGAARQHEWSVRLALGASRRRLVRQMLVESIVLAGIGGVLGLLVARWGSRALVAQLSTSIAPVFLDLSLDWHVMAFTTAISVATALLCGTAPAFRATRATPIAALKEQGRSSVSGDARSHLSGGLVVAQVALSLILLVAAGLFIRTFERLATLPLGFDTSRVLVVNVNTMRANVQPANRMVFYDQLVGAIDAVLGVEHAAMSMITPVSGLMNSDIVNVPGSAPMSDEERSVRVHYVTPGWFATYGTRIHSGRDFNNRDRRNAPAVVLVNEAFLRRFMPGRNAIGETFTSGMARPGETPVPRTIIGVVGDTVYGSLRDEVPPTVYQPLAQMNIPPGNVSMSIRAAAGSPVALARGVAAALTAVDRNLTFSFHPLADQINASLMQERLVAMLSGFFGVLALLLAALGLYGVTSYGVSRRRTEIGIRMALGAQRADVIRMVLRQSLVMIAVGIVLGLAGAAAVTRYLEAMLFGLTPLDPTTFIAVSVIFALVATLASYIPARRASHVDPLVALRAE